MEVGIFLRVRRRRRINLQTVLTPNPGEGRDRKSKNQGARQQRAGAADAERHSRVYQGTFDPYCDRMRATKHAPRDPCRVLERCHALAEIVYRGAVDMEERLRVNQVGLMLDGDYAEHAMRELQRRADANPDDVSSSEGPLDSDDDAATVETASAETASGNAHSWCVIS